MFDFLLRLVGIRVHVSGVLSVVAIVIVIFGLGLGVMLFWPKSRKWALANRSHRLASRNDGEIRRETCLRLDRALRSLKAGRKESERRGLYGDVTSIDLLISKIRQLRDRVEASYSPSLANFSGSNSGVALEILNVSEALSRDCDVLYDQARKGERAPAAIGSVEQNLKMADDWRFLS